ncbi:MAG: M56 family metallopeptidase, partial [Clostridia bacterium]|nr:M56 family metallopeptidase [Clostridia bacterium]
IEDVMRVGFFVWVTVALALIIAMAIVYFVTKKELCDAVRIRDNVYYSEKVNTPAVYGIIRPRIIFPTDQTDKYVLLHEQTHIKRQDNLCRMIAIVTACIHWFNPLVWLFLKLYISDSELACDEAVIAKLQRSEHKDYALTLLRYTGKKTVYASPFGGAGVRTRIERILSYKKLSVLSVISFALLVLFTAYFLLTNSMGG